jgi:hypothetical protein
MKAKVLLMRIVLAGFLASFFYSNAYSQDNPTQAQDTVKQKVVVLKNDGSSFTGVIIHRDERELLLETDNLGRIYIPLHEVKEIRPFEISGRGSTLFSTRYFLTTNGLSMEKGDKYGILNYYGPEAHFAVGNNFSLGIMTTWVAMPIIGSAKLSFPLGEKAHLGIGLLAGTLSWAELSSAGALLYGSITFGDYHNNFTLSGGFAGITTKDGGGSAPLLSPACLIRVGTNVYFLVDTFIYLGKGDAKFGVIVPGLRINRPLKRSSFQFGFAGVAAGGELMPMPIPIVSWLFEL